MGPFTLTLSKSPGLRSRPLAIGTILIGVLFISHAKAAENTPPPPAQAQPVRTLKEAYAAAVARSETLGIQQELLVQSEELQKQAKGAILPSIGASATFLKQQTPTSSVGNDVSPGTQSTIKLTGDQPLFRGFRDFAALRQRDAATDAQSLAVQDAARQLFYDLSTAYYNVLAFQQDCANYRNEIEINQKRLKELQNFLKIGRSRESDLLTFKSNIATVEAALAGSESQLEASKDILAFLTGWSRETVLQNNEPEPGPPGSLDVYLGRIEQRPDVKVAVSTARENEEGISIARGAHLPSVDLLGDYYFERPGVALNGVNWDLQLAISMPLFQGGIISSQVRQAQSVYKQYELQLSRVRRTAEEEIRTIFDAYSGDQLQMAKLMESAKWSKLNYESEIKDYRNGLVTNLDVLLAITTYQDAQRLLDHQHFLVQTDAVKIQAATAQRPEIVVSIESAGK